MANVKISELTAYPAVANPTTDLLEIVDSTTPATLVNKKVTARTLSYGGSKVTLVAGSNVTLTTNDASQTITISATGGGGGGGDFSSITARWTTANATSKNAQTAPGTINSDGITITLAAQANPGTLTAWTIRLNGTALANTYTATGAFPTYTITIPVLDLVGNAAETTATVTVALSNSMFNLTANNLTNNQPVAFSTTLSGIYNPNTVPFYTQTSSINYSYSNSAAITAFNGVITPTGGSALNATAASGTFPGQPIAGAAITGQATGNGQFGAGSATVNLSGSIAAVNTFVPAWFSQTANSTPPLFDTTDAVAPATPVTNTNYQTPGDAQGSTVDYPVATQRSQYGWICSQRPLANIMVQTQLGNVPLVADVTASQSLGGQTFAVYGFTRLGVGTAVTLVIS